MQAEQSLLVSVLNQSAKGTKMTYCFRNVWKSELSKDSMTKLQGDFIWKLNNKLFAWVIFDTLLFISTLILHLQPTYWIPLFEGNKLIIRVLFLTLIQHYIRNLRGNAFKHQHWIWLHPLVTAQKFNFMQQNHLEKNSSYTAKILSS